MTPERAAYRDMWLAEMGGTCRELSPEDRAVQALQAPVPRPVEKLREMA